ncbi:hypothetical protein Dimus_007821 [Dionaea muscipula]
MNHVNHQVLDRVDSDATMRFISKSFCCRVLVERSWSGNLTPPTHYEKDGSSGMVKKTARNHRRILTTGAVDFEEEMTEPKLVRSGGIRRDWSFECLEHTERDRNGEKRERR